MINSTSSYINTNENFQSSKTQSNNIQNTNTTKTITNNSSTEMNYQQVDYLQNGIHNYLGNGIQPAYNHIYAPLQQQQQLASKENFKIELEDKELWTRFYNLTNEMILTKAGRRTFPLIKLKLDGLEDNSLYTVKVEFQIADNYKYRFVNGEWRTSPRNDSIKNQSPPVIYQHTDSPTFGKNWTKDSIAFGKLKLTNNENSKNSDAVFLKSLHKYNPVIQVYKHDKKDANKMELAFTHFFKETQFIAVTAYQNENITGLKIKHNPFAKAFLNNKPTISVEGDIVITTSPPPQKEQPSISYLPYQTKSNEQTSTQQKQIQSKPIEHQIIIQHQPSPPVQSIQQPSSNLLMQTPVYPKLENIYPNPEFFQNIYNNYYPLKSTQPIYNQPQSEYYPYQTTPYSFQLNSCNNDYFYQQNQYQNPPNNQFNYMPQDNSPPMQQYDYQNQLPEFQNNSKQSSPIYNEINYQKSNNLKRGLNGLKENRIAPYSTTRPAKRSNTGNVDLPLSISPVNTIAKLDYNEQSDDSLNVTDNFFTQSHNQTLQSNNSTSSSLSFTLSSTGSNQSV